MSESNNWYVITGGPSSGKTSLLEELQKRGYQTLPEAARAVIDQGLAKGLSVEQIRADEQKFQEEVAKMKIQIESNHPSDILTFIDRGMHDTLAYMLHYGYEVADWIQEALQKATYQAVFILDQLPVFDKDYARTEKDGFADKISKELEQAYTESGLKPIRVPVMPVAQRADFIQNFIGGKA
jgi:predicted ATPase